MSEHVTVLKQEAIEALNIREDGIYVDMTLGGGGHSEAILSRLTTGHLYAFDQDEFAIEKSKERLSRYQNVTFIRSNFENVISELSNRGISKVDGILFDLGVSSFQFDIPERGFSYQKDNPLDMRMDQSQNFSAKDIVNEYTQEELSKIFFEYGEEPFAKSIAKAIVLERAKNPIETTFQLVQIVKSALPQKILNKKGHPAKQTFQALRIAVNDELHVFEHAIKDSISLLRKNGRIVVITFHSLEDRICKQVFRDFSTIYIPKGLAIIPDEEAILRLISKKVILPSEAEVSANNRAHSAKMRVAEKSRD